MCFSSRFHILLTVIAMVAVIINVSSASVLSSSTMNNTKDNQQILNGSSNTSGSSPADEWAEIAKDVISVGKKIFNTFQGETEELVKVDVEKTLGPLNNKISALEVATNTTQGGISEVTSAISNLSSRAAFNEKREGILEDTIAGIRSDVNSYSQLVNSYRTELFGVEHRIIKEVQTLDLTMNTKFGEVNTKFGEMNTKFGEVNTKFGEMNTKFGEVNTKLGEMQASINQLIEQIQSLIHPTTRIPRQQQASNSIRQ